MISRREICVKKGLSVVTHWWRPVPASTEEILTASQAFSMYGQNVHSAHS